jgi:Uma2 family endonuclease
MATRATTRPSRPTRRPSQPFTYEDYRDLPDSREWEEVLGGRLTVGPSPSTQHQGIAIRLAARLLDHVLERGLGEVYDAPTDVVLSDENVVVPDIVFVSNERRELIQDGGIFGAPDLIIEIISPSAPQRDTEVKRRIYAEHGVRHYWIVDPNERRIRLLRLSEAGEYDAVGEHAGEETFCAEPFPELHIPLGRIWPDQPNGGR